MKKILESFNMKRFFSYDPVISRPLCGCVSILGILFHVKKTQSLEYRDFMDCKKPYTRCFLRVTRHPSGRPISLRESRISQVLLYAFSPKPRRFKSHQTFWRPNKDLSHESSFSRAGLSHRLLYRFPSIQLVHFRIPVDRNARRRFTTFFLCLLFNTLQSLKSKKYNFLNKIKNASLFFSFPPLYS